MTLYTHKDKLLLLGRYSHLHVYEVLTTAAASLVEVALRAAPVFEWSCVAALGYSLKYIQQAGSLNGALLAFES